MTAAAHPDLQLRICGVVSDCIYRTTLQGHAQLEIKLAAPGGQMVRALHTYPSNSASCHHVANNLARLLKGQTAELYATEPRFARQRLDCIAIHVSLVAPSTPHRKDIDS